MFRVAIIGRPNVGKSTLFNRLVGKRRALVGNEPGITRDRIFDTAEWEGKAFEVVDTGGIIPDSRDPLPELVLSQAEVAIQESDLILFVVDVRDGLTPLDQEINALLKSRGKEFLLVVNKVDVPQLAAETFSFYRLGVETLYPVSAEHKEGVGELVAEIVRRIPAPEGTTPPEETRVAIVGRPNVGKSSLLNRLLGSERVIVSQIPGTTRDAVDSLLRYGDQTFRLIDTAGIRRKGRTQRKTEKLSVVMARKHMEQADVVLLVLDAVQGATHLDATIGGYAHKAGKSILLVVNKWDLVEKDSFTALRKEEEFRQHFRFLDYAPMVFVSARTGQRVKRLLELAGQARQARGIRIPTGALNQFLEAEVAPRLSSGRTRRKSPFKYACQVAVAPPTLVLFLRGSRKLHFSTLRFISNRLREQYGFFATPVRILQRTARPARRS